MAERKVGYTDLDESAAGGGSMDRIDPCRLARGEGCSCPDSACPFNTVFDIIGGKWKLKILCSLFYVKTMRYGDLKRQIESISTTMLAKCLRELEEMDIVSRTVLDTMPVQVEYALTDTGRTLMPFLVELKDWAIAYQEHLA